VVPQRRATILLVTDRMDWHARAIARALASFGVTMVHADLGSCEFDTSQAFGLVLPSLKGQLPDAVLVRTISAGSFEAITRRLGILHALHSLNVLVWNEARAIERCVDKSMTSFLLARQGIPTPLTYVVETLASARAILDRPSVARKWVLKPLFGSQGKGLRLVTRADELPQSESVAGVYYLQEYKAVESDGFRDFRVLVSSGRVVAAMMRRATTWITNVKQGGTPVSAVIDVEMRELAIAAAKAVGATFAGVDLLVGADGRPTVLEVNSMPAWSGLQKVTSRDIATAICADLVGAIEAQRNREAS
jgi:tetrahydromethanopterin:alpha-L-glutamate ligase